MPDSAIIPIFQLFKTGLVLFKIIFTTAVHENMAHIASHIDSTQDRAFHVSKWDYAVLQGTGGNSR